MTIRIEKFCLIIETLDLMGDLQEYPKKHFCGMRVEQTTLQLISAEKTVIQLLLLLRISEPRGCSLKVVENF